MQNLNAMISLSKGLYSGYTVYTENPAGGSDALLSGSSTTYVYACVYSGNVVTTDGETTCAVQACFGLFLNFPTSFLYMPFSTTCYSNCVPVETLSL